MARAARYFLCFLVIITCIKLTKALPTTITATREEIDTMMHGEHPVQTKYCIDSRQCHCMLGLPICHMNTCLCLYSKPFGEQIGETETSTDSNPEVTKEANEKL